MELRRDVAIVWNGVQYVDAVAEVTTHFVYLRFIGDRSLRDLGRVQIDRTEEMRKWASWLRAVEGGVDRAYAVFNNHFAGPGPGGVNAFRQILGLPEVSLEALHVPEPGQMRLAGHD